MSLNELQVFNKYVMPATIETLAQMTEGFNSASNGTIRLTTEGFEGDFMQESFFQSLAAARRRVDRYAANDPVAATALVEARKSSVKVAGGFGPVEYEPSALGWLRRPTQQGIEAASRAFAELLLQDQLNTAIAAVAAAIGNQPTAINDVSGTGPITHAAINGAHAKFGDAASSIRAHVMSGLTYHTLIGQNLANTSHLFRAGDVMIVDILGRPTVVTDAPALYVAGTPNKSRVLGLVSDAATIFDASDLFSNVDTPNGKQRITTSVQVDYSFGVGLKGYSWDTANGGKSPTDAELATGSNWDKVATSIKHTAGVMAIGSAD